MKEVKCECDGIYIFNQEQKVFACSKCNKLPYQDELDEIQEDTTSMEEKLEAINKLI